MLTNIELEEAQKLLLNKVACLSAETVPILQALGRVNADDILAQQNLPSCMQAARDGFAVHQDDIGNVQPVIIKEWLQVGDIPTSPVKRGEAVGVVTGGILPEKTAAVIPCEKVQANGQQLVLSGYKSANSFIKLPGEDFKVGEVIALKSTRFTPGLIGLLAAMGTKQVSVYRRPRVAILSLAKQVVSYQKDPVLGQIRDSNGPLLATLVMRDGGEIIAVNTCTGIMDSGLKIYITELLKKADLVLTTGGTFAYQDSETCQIFKAIGSDLIFQGIPMQPGGHNTAFRRESRLIISHSGNPAACLVGYELLSAPLIRAMQGISPFAAQTQAVCLDDLPAKKGERRFVRGYARYSDNQWQVKILPGQKPGMFRSLINYNALIDIPVGNPPVKAGDEVSIILVNSFHTGNEYFQF